MKKCEFCSLDKVNKEICINCNSVSWGSVIQIPLGSAQLTENDFYKYNYVAFYAPNNFCKIIVLKTSRKILLKDLNGAREYIRVPEQASDNLNFIELVFSINVGAISKWKISNKGNVGICWQFDDSLSNDDLLEAARQIKNIWDGIILLC